MHVSQDSAEDNVMPGMLMFATCYEAAWQVIQGQG